VFKRLLAQSKYRGDAEKGYNEWRDYVISFGLNQTLNQEGFSEKSGWVPASKTYNKLYGKGAWKAPTLISLSVGQGELLLTPLQIANFYSVIANKGYYITPHLVKKVGEDSTFNPAFTQRKEVSIDQKFYKPIYEGLELVVEDGTGKGSRIPGIRMGGKTGTAENPHGIDHSIFAAIAPMDDPEIAICVFVENSGFGSTWAAPIASLMIEKYMNDTIMDSRKYLEERMINGNLINGK
jgi:penicillin-binding protein 2